MFTCAYIVRIVCCLGVAAALAWASVVDMRERLIPLGALALCLGVWAFSLLGGCLCAVVGASQEACALALPLFDYESAAAFAPILGGGSMSWCVAAFLQGAAGALVTSGFSLACALVLEGATGRESLGGGDVKLLFVTGLFLGPTAGLAALGCACASFAAFALARQLWVRVRCALAPQAQAHAHASASSPVLSDALPFAPFISLSALAFMAYATCRLFIVG